MSIKFRGSMANTVLSIASSVEMLEREYRKTATFVEMADNIEELKAVVMEFQNSVSGLMNKKTNKDDNEQ